MRPSFGFVACEGFLIFGRSKSGLSPPRFQAKSAATQPEGIPQVEYRRTEPGR